MKTIARQIKERLDAKNEEATRLYAEFDSARKSAMESGVDLSDPANEDTFNGLNEKHKSYAAAADEVAELQSKMMEALEMDGADTPKSVAELLGVKPDQGGEGKGKLWSPGQKFADSDEYKGLLESGALTGGPSQVPSVQTGKVAVTDREEAKALLTGLSRTSAGAFLTPDRQDGFIPLALRQLVMRQLVTVGDTDSDIVEWVKENTFTNAAAETAEATATTGSSGTKPESAIDYAVVQSTVKTIAHWIPSTKRALADVGQLRTLVDSRLQDGINLRLDSQMLNGDATGENLRGILNTSGVLTQARGTDPGIEAILKAVTQIRLQFLEPTAILMHPTDAMNARLAKNANGDYYFGPPNVAGDNLQVWGLPIVTSPVIALGTALVGKFNEAILWVREGITLAASDNVNDDFIRNMVRVLAEMRVAFAVPRAFAFCTVTGL